MKKKLKLLETADVSEDTIWDKLQEQVQVTAVQSGIEAWTLLQENQYDVVLINRMLHGMDGLELLRRVKSLAVCPLVVLTSEKPDFQYAQQGIVYGVFDYLLRPLTMESVHSLLMRIQQRLYDLDEIQRKDCMLLVQSLRTTSAGQVYDEVLEQIASRQTDFVQTELAIRQLYRMTVRQLFAKYIWLHHFLKLDSFAADCIPDEIEYSSDFCRQKLMELHTYMIKLYPETANKKLDKAMQYILEHMDSRCLQKDVAAAMYISPAALSELFQSQLGISFHGYNTEIKLLRAHYLCQHTTEKIYQISHTLGYKDVDYFSHIFQKRFGVSMSACRSIVSNYD